MSRQIIVGKKYDYGNGEWFKVERTAGILAYGKYTHTLTNTPHDYAASVRRGWILKVSLGKELPDGYDPVMLFGIS